MALSQALSTGISGLVTHQKAMDNVGNNLANVNTTGFKKGIFQFRTLLEQSYRGGMGADSQTGRGSINPIQLGLGTQTGSINKVFTQGPLENTSNPNDMAIEGNGFFVLRQGNGYAYTRDGAFYVGVDGSLMGGNGLYVQGTMAVKDSSGGIYIPNDAKLENIVITLGETGGMVQTSKVEFGGNVSSDQKVAQGLRLFGGTTWPTINNQQQWMWKSDFNGGDPYYDKSVDDTWRALEDKTYVVTQEVLDLARAAGHDMNNMNIPKNVSSFTSNLDAVSLGNSYPSKMLNARTGAIVDVPAGSTVNNVLNMLEDPLDPTSNVYIPLVEEVKTINGGNVQTSAAYSILVPDTYTRGQTVPNMGIVANNDYTYPQWFYESTGSSMPYRDIVSALNSMQAVLDDVGATQVQKDDAVNNTLKAIWLNGINGDIGDGINSPGWGNNPITQAMLPAVLPKKDEEYPASLNTPLEHLRYQKGSSWTSPFANIKDGDEITISFKKGEGTVEATFTYNRPGPDPLNPPQQPIDIEKSYTLEHFIKFLAGDVDEPSVACMNINPAMYGAARTADYPDGNPHQTTPPWDSVGYKAALENVKLAQTSRNLDETGGAMGLLSIPPRISTGNYGDDMYDAPVESAGAYTRIMNDDVSYYRDSDINGRLPQEGSSFRVSFVSNLGEANALSDIKISYNNVTHESMFSGETEYAAKEGGYTSASMTFYDSLGNPKEATVRMAMVSQDNDFTTWRWYADCTDDTDFPWQVDENGEVMSNLNVGTGLIRFDKNGNYVKGSEYTESGGITINQANRGVNEPIVVKMLNGLSSSDTQDLDFSGMKMSSAQSDFALKNQNGRPPGTLDSFQVTADGVIQGVYSNGVTAPIARLVLAMIPNQNGLIAGGGSIFYTGPSSGDAQIGYANLGGRGQVHQKQLENSNVDLSEEFTKLISIERGFQANSRTITTADEMLQELLNLKR